MIHPVRVRERLVPAVVFVVCAALFPHAAGAQQGGGSQLRVLDSAGLIRATKVVVESATVKISVDGGGSGRGECVATNLDGLAAERKVALSSAGECSFEKLPAGSWQVKVPDSARWRAQIYE